jgi:hypothetical protein
MDKRLPNAQQQDCRRRHSLEARHVRVSDGGLRFFFY